MIFYIGLYKVVAAERGHVRTIEVFQDSIICISQFVILAKKLTCKISKTIYRLFVQGHFTTRVNGLGSSGTKSLCCYLGGRARTCRNIGLSRW